MLNISFESKELHDNESIAVLVNDQLKINNDTVELDQKHHGIISKIIQDKTKFTGKLGQLLSLTSTDKEGKVFNIIIAGIGDESKIKSYDLENVGGTIYRAAKSFKSKSVGIKISERISEFEPEDVASWIGSGALLSSYKFDKYLTTKKPEEKNDVNDFNIIVEKEEETYQAFKAKKAVAMAVYFARDLVSEVPNVLYPESYAEKIVTTLEPLGVDIQVLGEREMTDLGMGALLGVGQGSMRESKLVVMKYDGAEEDQKPVAFVGKGVTFDTGGISIKPAARMSEMKYDMGGSASVVGAMKALALRGAKVNAIGIVGLVENMPGSNAQRPGDVVKTMSGKTAEVLNTDAEGRLVLCDCLTYLQENFKDLECIIDLATLTGAILVALGNTYAGCFSNDDELYSKLETSSKNSNELIWRMPLHKDFDDMIKTPVADVANIGSGGGVAGSATAAHFLEHFINENVKWAHLDIAGMAWDSNGKKPTCPKGAVGYGVKLLNQFIQDHYEQK